MKTTGLVKGDNKESVMDLNQVIRNLKSHPDYHKMGMIASHLGVVRKTSLNGRTVKGVTVKFDHKIVDKIVYETNLLAGIVEVIVHTSEGTLSVGDDIMIVVVGGDIRDHVFPALMSVVNRIKAEAVEKNEIFETGG